MSKLPIDVPKEKLQQVRMDMLRKVQREKRTKKRIVSVAIISLFCLSFLFSIRVSPTIASQIAKIPGFEALVSAVARDKGIQDIVDNDYFEEINVTKSKNGLSLTLQGVIADHSGLVFFYDTDASFDISKLKLERVQLFQGGKEMNGGGSFAVNVENQTSISTGKYDFFEPNAYTSKNFKVVFHFNEEDEENIEIMVPFTLQNEIANEKIFTANRTINVNGQKFTITQIRRSPLEMALDIEVDESNTMEILSFDDIAVEMQDGERRESIKHRPISKDIRDGKFTLYLESNYFYDPESLKIIIGTVHAVSKGEDFIEVDFGTKEVLKKPDYLDWDISVTQQDVSVAINKRAESRFLLLTDAVKEDGTGLEIKGATVSRDEQYKVETTQFDEYDGKAKIYINYFFNPIGENIEVNIPLQ